MRGGGRPGPCQAKRRAYTVRLTVTDSAGTSTAQVFTGQTVSRQGGPLATVTHVVTVSAAIPPPVGATLSGLRVSPKTVSLAGRRVHGHCVKATSKNHARKHCTLTIALKISYRLSKAATVAFTLTRQVPGRKVNGHCGTVTKMNRGRKHCTLAIKVPGAISHASATGANSFTFNGAIAGRTLRPGTYQLTAALRGGKPLTVTFKISG